MQICKYLQHSSVKDGVWNIQVKSSPEAKRDFPLLSLLSALYNSSHQLAGLERLQLNSWSWKGPDRGFGVWVGLGMHCTGVRDKFCLLQRRCIFLAASDKITHDDSVKLVFWPGNWKLGSGTSLFFTCSLLKKKKRTNTSYESIIWKVVFGIRIRYSLGEL